MTFICNQTHQKDVIAVYKVTFKLNIDVVLQMQGKENRGKQQKT